MVTSALPSVCVVCLVLSACGTALLIYMPGGAGSNLLDEMIDSSMCRIPLTNFSCPAWCKRCCLSVWLVIPIFFRSVSVSFSQCCNHPYPWLRNCGTYFSLPKDSSHFSITAVSTGGHALVYRGTSSYNKHITYSNQNAKIHWRTIPSKLYRMPYKAGLPWTQKLLTATDVFKE